MARFHGFTARQQASLRDDITRARGLAMGAVNRLLLTPDGRPAPRTRELLWWVFTVDQAGQAFWDALDPIKTVYLSFAGRFETLDIRLDAGAPDPARLEFAAYVPRGQPQLFVRPSYLAMGERERALTLIHEHVHLVRPHNEGDGHPGGVFALFHPAPINISYADAIRNPYCFQYFADWINP